MALYEERRRKVTEMYRAVKKTLSQKKKPRKIGTLGSEEER